MNLKFCVLPLKCYCMCRMLHPLLPHICILVFSILQYWTLHALFLFLNICIPTFWARLITSSLLTFKMLPHVSTALSSSWIWVFQPSVLASSFHHFKMLLHVSKASSSSITYLSPGVFHPSVLDSSCNFPLFESVYSNLLCTPHHFITCVFIILTLWRLLTPILPTELRACSILSDPTELFDRGLANILLGILSFWSSILLEASLLCVWLFHTHKTGSGAAGINILVLLTL